MIVYNSNENYEYDDVVLLSGTGVFRYYNGVSHYTDNGTRAVWLKLQTVARTDPVDENTTYYNQKENMVQWWSEADVIFGLQSIIVLGI